MSRRRLNLELAVGLVAFVYFVSFSAVSAEVISHNPNSVCDILLQGVGTFHPSSWNPSKRLDILYEIAKLTKTSEGIRNLLSALEELKRKAANDPRIPSSDPNLKSIVSQCGGWNCETLGMLWFGRTSMNTISPLRVVFGLQTRADEIPDPDIAKETVKTFFDIFYLLEKSKDSSQSLDSTLEVLKSRQILQKIFLEIFPKEKAARSWSTHSLDALLPVFEEIKSSWKPVDQKRILDWMAKKDPPDQNIKSLSGPLVNNSVPHIHGLYEATSAQNVLGAEEFKSVDDGRKQNTWAIYNPVGSKISQEILSRIEKILHQAGNPSDMPMDISLKLYKNYLKLFPPETPLERISVLGPPFARKNWDVDQKDREDIIFDPDWNSPTIWGVPTVLYITDGKLHYSIDIHADTMRRYRQTADEKKPKVVAEIMVAPSLSQLERMLSARFKLDQFSSQPVFQVGAPELLDFDYFQTDAEWEALLLSNPKK